jgi:hypothetical protein
MRKSSEGTWHKILPTFCMETYMANAALLPPSSQVVVTIHDMIHERFPNSCRTMTPRLVSRPPPRDGRTTFFVSLRIRERDVIEILGVHPVRCPSFILGSSLSVCKPRSRNATCE